MSIRDFITRNRFMTEGRLSVDPCSERNEPKERKWHHIIKQYRTMLDQNGIEAEAMDLDDPNPTDCDLECHAMFMLNQMDKMLDEGEVEKFQRWFGFVQSLLFITKYYTINQLRSHVTDPYVEANYNV